MTDEALILLVEDNQADVDLIKYTFKKNQMMNRIITIADGKEAVDYILRTGKHLDAEIADLIILDINLPKLSGLEVLKIIKKDEVARLIPVVILTTSSSDVDVLEAYSNYVNAYLVKPVEIEEFINIIIQLEQFMLKIVRRPNLK